MPKTLLMGLMLGIALVFTQVRPPDPTQAKVAGFVLGVSSMWAGKLIKEIIEGGDRPSQ